MPERDVEFDEDLETVRHRVIAKLLESTVGQHQIDELMSSIREDGSWPGIDYADTSRTGFEHQEHLDNMLALGRAYRQPGSPYHDDAEVREAVWRSHHRHDRVTSTLTYGLGFANYFVDWADKVTGTRFAFPDESAAVDTPGLVMVKMSGQAVEEITTADPTRQGRSIPVRLRIE